MTIVDFPSIAVYRHTCSSDDDQRPDFGGYFQQLSSIGFGKQTVDDDCDSTDADAVASVQLAVNRQLECWEVSASVTTMWPIHV